MAKEGIIERRADNVGNEEKSINKVKNETGNNTGIRRESFVFFPRRRNRGGAMSRQKVLELVSVGAQGTSECRCESQKTRTRN